MGFLAAPPQVRSSVPPVVRGVAAKKRWKDRPDEHDYPAAEDYLSLVTSPAEAKSWLAAGALRRLSVGKPKTCCAPAGFHYVHQTSTWRRI